MTMLAMTVFLPITRLVAIPIRSHPDSRYTLGMALIGGVAYLAVPGFIVGLVSQNWWLAGLSAYFFTGSFVVGNTLRARGYLD